MSRLITPVDAAIFTALLGIAMVLTGREIGGAIVISASLCAFIFFEWYLSRRRPSIATEQWENAISEKDETLNRKETALNELQARLRAEGEKRLPMFGGEVDVLCPPEYRD
ncbi:hypothetical protein [Sinorhizobium meliloti]|uniref:hypothetical protein n=1 Tax=Rhizobium meliloti TaxID=382 RepID=UPI000FD6FF1A|nr:hypothetical protein [Sinorhizobium meliloti]RVK40906.1 hypothetical protein CN163_08420 [Sinorhizobium meliloti]